MFCCENAYSAFKGHTLIFNPHTLFQENSLIWFCRARADPDQTKRKVVENPQRFLADYVLLQNANRFNLSGVCMGTA